MLSQLEQYRRIIQDLAETTLAGQPGSFARLNYLSSLRNMTGGQFEHERLTVLYGEAAVQQALAQCHEEIFEKILEIPLEMQLQELRFCLQEMQGGLMAAVSHWRRLEIYRALMPEQAPDYLKELFCSNLRILLEILQGEESKAHSGA